MANFLLSYTSYLIPILLSGGEAMEAKTNASNILIVDDEIGPRESLRMVLKPNYNVYTVENGYAAIQMIQQVEMDVLTLDLKMPGMNGIETLKEIRMISPDVMVIIITGYGTLKTAIEAIRYGVFDYIPKPFNVPEILSIIDKSIQRRKLNLKVKEVLGNCFNQQLLKEPVANDSLLPEERKAVSDCKWDEINLSDTQSCLEFAKVLAYTLEEKDPYTSGHSERVCYYSDFISKRLSLSPKERSELQIASYLHDIGKIGISNRFINKKGTLTSTDWAVIKQHTKKSIELLVPLNLSSSIISYIQHHHERYDGTGYPDGLAGEKIPLGARIIAISDSYDSMTSDRPYRKPLTNGDAKSELLKNAGKQFDPKLVALFLDVLKEMEEVFLVKDHLRVPAVAH
ncbi:MAG: response regulator [Deltaproteobacteria bacterium]|jgi:response regulator RpfG family c-di-GMP phosphodiesterase|nr:response regulator [Deltaproteobacteria bacterium]